jgi:hypothetical protein
MYTVKQDTSTQNMQSVLFCIQQRLFELIEIEDQLLNMSTRYNFIPKDIKQDIRKVIKKVQYSISQELKFLTSMIHKKHTVSHFNSENNWASEYKKTKNKTI